MSKPIKVMISILVSLTIIGVATIVILIYADREPVASGERTLEEMVESSFETTEITTDLSDGNFVRIQFRIVTDGKDAIDQLQQGEQFQLNNVILKELTLLEEEDLRTGLDELESNLKSKLNELLDEGEVTHVFTIDKVLQ